MEVVFDVTDRIQLEQENSNLFLQVVDALTHLIERRDVSTGHHSDRVRELAVEIGRELGLGTDEIEEISMAGMLHDIGKIGIPEYILNKPGRLTSEEYEIIKQHPQIGYDAIKNIKPLAKIALAVLYHHEKYNNRRRLFAHTAGRGCRISAFKVVRRVFRLENPGLPKPEIGRADHGLGEELDHRAPREEEPEHQRARERHRDRDRNGKKQQDEQGNEQKRDHAASSPLRRFFSRDARTRR